MPDGRSSDAGFTMVEIIVSMVLLAVALALASGGMLQSISGGSSSRSGAASDAAVARATARFADDVAGTVTEDLRDGALRDPAEFRDAVQRNAVATSSDPSTPGRVLDIDAVVRASSDELQLRVEANRTPGIECVTWRVLASGGYQLERLVDRAGGCGTGSLGRETLVSAPAGVVGLSVNPFTYQLVCSGCPGGGPSCRSFVRGAVAPAQRRWIVAASMSVVSVTKDRSASTAAGSTKSSIRARDTETYRRALGC